VAINPAYRTRELAYALRRSGTRLLISATLFKSSDYRRMVGEVRSEVRYVHIVDEFPMTVTGKVRKVDMRAESVRLLGL
jgi:hypothetical protein